MQRLGDFRLPPFFNYPPYFTLFVMQDLLPMKQRKCSLQLSSVKVHSATIDTSLVTVVASGCPEWMDKGHKKCLILWLRIQDWANFIFNFVKDNGLEVMTIEEIRSGIDTRGTGEFNKFSL
ncbi:Vacuolar protein sorting-associated protein 25 [Zea mays]|uniref:Vacuolar protein sorting-associated protein 25 n=1 Tax=Zea mays TaxID=4577 RepID=A0A3L6DUX7_MAIZE|nr:Vacuolar protein sorting-associated protein 25 [Zea mays]